MTDRIVPPLSAGEPYYDDYDEDKKFLRAIFRPGYSVQARELTQIQTILQKQIDRFGSHIFQNGSIVAGGETFFDKKVVYLKLLDTYSGSTVSVSSFLNQQIQDMTNTAISGRVIAVEEKTSNGSEPKTLIVQLDGNNTFSPGASIQVVDSAVYATLSSADDAVGNSSIVKINDGVFFINGFFVKMDASVLILEKYSNLPSYKIGLQINDSIVTESTDATLRDPAFEASNYSAPGAARYKIELTLSKRALNSTDDSKFVELMRVESGLVTTQVLNPQYSELEKTLARRTYDESGDYTVRPFNIILKNHIGTYLTGGISAANNSTSLLGYGTNFTQEVANNDYIQYGTATLGVSSVTVNTSLTTSNSTPFVIPANSVAKVVKDNYYTIQLDPGKAYIRGFEYETIGPSYLSSVRGRDSANVTSYDLSLNFGNYFFANSSNGFIDVSTTPIVDLHNTFTANVSSANNTWYNLTKIGTARVLAQDYVSGQGNTAIYRVHLYDIRLTTANASFANVNCLSSSSTKAATLDVSTASKDGANSANATLLTDVGFGTLVYQFPQQSIVPGSITGQSYTTKTSFTNQTLTAVANVATSPTLSLSSGQQYIGSGTLDAFTTRSDFIVVVRDRLTSNLVTGQVLDYANNNLRVSITGTTSAIVSASANATFVVDVISTVNQATSSPKTKTLVLANTAVCANVLQYPGILVTGQQTRIMSNIGQVQIASGYISNTNTWISLYLADVTAIKVIQDANTTADLINTSKDITNNFLFDNGQRDTFYDYAQIKLKPGYTAPTGNVIVLCSYYTHTGSGYATVDSYPNASSNGYALIPSFTSPTTGQVYTLRDSVDFRPRRIDANTASTPSDLTTTPSFTLQNARLFDPETQFVVSNFGYYLGRIDKVVLSKDLRFKLITGIPAVQPVSPADDPDAMTLYVLKVPPYTFDPRTVEVTYIENKRYTMRDIGRIEKRVQALEYYNSLNLLEKKATDMVITDADGLPRSKYGVLVDSFVGFQIADVTARDLFVSMDTQNGEMRPYFNQNIVPLDYTTSSGVTKSGNIYTLPYDTVFLAVQPYATTYEPVAAYSFANWLGSLKITPESDYWYDTTRAPDVNINLNGANDNWVQLGQLLSQISGNGVQNPFGTVWNAWQTQWTGSSSTIDSYSAATTVTPASSYLTQNPDPTLPGISNPEAINIYTIANYTSSVTTKEVRSGVQTTLSPETITQSLGDKILDVSIIPYIRAQDIVFVGKNFRPNRYLKAFFDDQDVTMFCERLDKITLNTAVSFADQLEQGEVVSTVGGFSANVVLSDGNLLYVKDLTGNVSANDALTGATSGLTANVVSYTHRSGNVVTANATTVTLSLRAATANSEYANAPIYITTGTGAGQARTILSYDSNTKIAVIDSSWTTVPTSNSRYTLGLPFTTPSGALAGIFHLPSITGHNFRTGQRVFRMVDTISGSLATCTTSGEDTFNAQGVLETKAAETVSIRVPTVVKTDVTDSRTTTTVTSGQTYIGGTTIYPSASDFAGPITANVVVNPAYANPAIPTQVVITPNLQTTNYGYNATPGTTDALLSGRLYADYPMTVPWAQANTA